MADRTMMSGSPGSTKMSVMVINTVSISPPFVAGDHPEEDSDPDGEDEAGQRHFQHCGRRVIFPFEDTAAEVVGAERDGPVLERLQVARPLVEGQRRHGDDADRPHEGGR